MVVSKVRCGIRNISNPKYPYFETLFDVSREFNFECFSYNSWLFGPKLAGSIIWSDILIRRSRILHYFDRLSDTFPFDFPMFVVRVGPLSMGGGSSVIRKWIRPYHLKRSSLPRVVRLHNKTKIEEVKYFITHSVEIGIHRPRCKNNAIFEMGDQWNAYSNLSNFSRIISHLPH